MSKRWIKAAQIDQTIDLFILDSSSTTGAGLTGLTSGSSGLTCYYRKGATGTAQPLTLASQTVGGAHTDGGFVAIDGTNMPGLYRLDLSDTMVAVEGMLTILLKGATNMAPVVAELEIVDIDIYDSMRLGLTALPNAAAEASGGIATLSAAQSSNGTIPANMVAISGDVTAADNLETAADGGVYNLGGGGIVADSVTNNIGGNVTGNVVGNVQGSVNSVTTGVSLAANSVNTTSIQNGAITAIKIQDGAITNAKLASGAISSSTFATDAITSTVIATDAITSAELASSSVNEIADTVWGANVDTNSSGSAWGGNTFGRRSLRTSTGASYEVQVTNTNHISASVHEMQSGVITASSIAAGAIDANAIAAGAIDASALAADACAEIADAVWDEQLSGHLTAGSTGEALDDAAQGGGGGGGGSTTVRMGPFVIKAEGQGSEEPLDINKGATHAIECQLVDAEGTGVDITGATLTAKVYNSAGTLVETVSGTISYAALGQVRWTIGTTTTNTAGTYTVTITRTTGASDTQIFGPLRVYVRDV